MSDPLTSARSARESLSRALAALQSPGVPPQILGVAEPVSQAMSMLFQIERSGGAAIATHAPPALDAVRRALGMLQQQPAQHPAVQAAIEAVAGSLGLIHTVATAGGPAAAPQAAPAVYAATPAVAPAAYAAAPAAAPAVYAAAPAPYAGAPAAYAPPTGPQPPTSPGYAPSTGYAPNPAAPPPGQPGAPAAYGAPGAAYQQTALAPTAYEQAMAQPTHGAQPAAAAPRAAIPAAANEPIGRAPAASAAIISAELGVHSQSNFYKGLSGNDVVEHGGLFVATYKIPRVGQPVTLRVSMPGGYEFEAQAVVRWVRESVDSSQGEGAQPGFGAQFTQISPDARQLVYRYARNREPLFHDDL